MASKLILRFTGLPLEFDTINVAGKFFVFRNQRTNHSEITIGNDPAQLAKNFQDAFNLDVNFTNQFKVTWLGSLVDSNGDPLPPGDLHGIVSFEHPQNGYFDSFITPHYYIEYDVETTPQVSENFVNATFSQGTDACGRININIQTNVKSGKVVVEIPTGNVVFEQNIDPGGFNYDIDRVRSSAPTTGIARVYENGSTKVIVASRFIVPGVLSIGDVEVIGSPFGAIANIKATGTNLEYSLNQTSWKSSSEFPNLLEGDYIAYARDPYGCVKSYPFEVLPEHAQGISVPGMIHFPIHNSLRAVKRGGNIFTNFLAQETPGITPVKSFFQEYLVEDSIPMQFKSSYSSHTATLYDCHGNGTELFIQKFTNNISRINVYEGNFKAVDGKLAVYFTSGGIFNPDGSKQDFGHSLDGLLPKWYQADVFLNIEGLGVTRIDRIVFDEDEEIVYAVTEMEASGDGFNVQITSIHTENPYEVYEFIVNFLEPGNYFLEVNYGSGNVWFEPIKVREKLPERYLRVEWYADQNNDIVYSTGIKQLRWLPWVRYFTYKSTVEKEIFRSDTIVRNIFSKSYATYEIVFRPMPMEMARGIDFAFNAAGGVVEINGALFVCDGAVNIEPVGAYYKVTAELTLIGQSMSSPQYGVGDSFLVVDENANGVAFLRI